MALGVCAGLAAGAPPTVTGPDATASAYVARTSIPGQSDETAAFIAAPPDGSGGGPQTLPAEGPAVRIGTSTEATRAVPGTSSSAETTVSALGVSLLDGEISADSVSLVSVAAAGSSGATAETDRSAVTGLVVLGVPVTASDGLRLPVADWGTLELLRWTTEVDDQTQPHSAKAAIVGLRLELSAEHAGFPAGTVIEVGWAEATAVAAPPAVIVPATPTPTPVAGVGSPAPADPLATPAPGVLPIAGDPLTSLPAAPITPADRADREPGASIAGAPSTLIRPAPEVVARLTGGGYVFPVFGPASFGDTFGAYRGDVPGNWHHGEDIVAPSGTPLLAVADGTVFSVGWNAIGGWRLWLRDHGGNEFYYAHLSAYSPLAVEGRQVHAGEVLGFVGTTGDADGGIPHLHFEIHPASLLSLGYDGAVAPYPFLVGWRRAEDVSFTSGRRYVSDEDLRPGVGLPRVGAYVLEMNDIGRTSGLVPGALERAVAGPGISAQPLG